MSDTKRTQLAGSEDMLSQLPYQLSRGVVATLEGLDFSNELSITPEYFGYDHDNSKLFEPLIIPWSHAAERLRYLYGEPWCFDFLGDIMCIGSNKRPDPVDEDTRALDRLASMIADNGEAFRVLWWCVENLSGSNGAEEPGGFHE